MDNLCHTLVGAAMGEAGLKRRTRYGNPVLMLAANVPDVDALAFLTDVPAIAVRRGWTHGVLAQLLLPVILTGLVLAFDRWRPRRGAEREAGLGRRSAEREGGVRAGPILLLSYLGVLSHVGLDWLNTYGVRLLMPFSNRWFFGDAVFIIDPWLWLTLGAGVLLARRRRLVRPARVALALSAAYIAAMIGSAAAARGIVMDDWVRRHGAPPRGLMVGPYPAHPLRKTIIVDAGTHYRSGVFDWRTRAAEYGSSLVPRGDAHPAVARARERQEIRYVLVWSRFPFYRVERAPDGTRVTIQDMRFGDRLGSATVVVR